MILRLNVIAYLIWCRTAPVWATTVIEKSFVDRRRGTDYPVRGR